MYIEWQECKDKALEIAEENFYCPGVFNDEKFSKDFALFLILRKQCIRRQKTGMLNIPLALNNLTISLNSFGKVTVNEIVRLLFDPSLLPTITTMLVHLKSDVPRALETMIDEELLKELEKNHKRNVRH